jgi:hypothetical protein
MTTAEILSEWQKVADAATPAPWVRQGDRIQGIKTGQRIVNYIVTENPNDGELIALSREAVPRLIEALRVAMSQVQPDAPRDAVTLEDVAAVINEILNGQEHTL